MSVTRRGFLGALLAGPLLAREAVKAKKKEMPPKRESIIVHHAPDRAGIAATEINYAFDRWHMPRYIRNRVTLEGSLDNKHWYNIK